MPGETLENGIQNIFVLGEDQGLILKALEKFVDGVSVIFFFSFSCSMLQIIYTHRQSS